MRVSDVKPSINLWHVPFGRNINKSKALILYAHRVSTMHANHAHAFKRKKKEIRTKEPERQRGTQETSEGKEGHYSREHVPPVCVQPREEELNTTLQTIWPCKLYTCVSDKREHLTSLRCALARMLQGYRWKSKSNKIIMPTLQISSKKITKKAFDQNIFLWNFATIK